MKIMKIFGLVVAVHIAVFTLIFAIPGCRSGARPAPVDTGAAPGAATVTYAGSGGSLISAAPMSQPAGLNATQSSGAPRFDPYAPAAGSTRSAPTRPVSATPYVDAGDLAPVPPPAPAIDLTPTTTYTVVRGDSLWAVAKKHGITYQELAAANNLSSNASLAIDQKLIIPRRAVTAQAPEAAPSGPSYTVRSGDTLSTIARRNGTSVAALRSANGISGDIVRVGQVLLLPVEGEATSTPAQETAVAAPTQSAGSLTHVVLPGETLSVIARRYEVRSGDIALANNITDPRQLRAGQQLTIPGWQAPPGAPTPPAPAATAARPVPTAPATAPTVSLVIPGAGQDFTPAESDVPVIRVIDPDASGDN